MAESKHVRGASNSAARVIKEVTDYLTCPICYQFYKNPKYLTCYHSCCEECLVKLHKESTVVCPECRKVTATEGVRELPNNFFVTRLVDELTLKHTMNSEETIMCGQCVRGTTVVVFCSDCTLFLCDHCYEHHKYDKQCHNHNTISLSDISPDTVLHPKATTMLCPEHDNELNYYCESCKELVCLYCTTKKHGACEHEVIKKIVGKHRKNLDDVVAPINKMVDNLLQARQQVDSMLKEINAQYENVSEKIEQFYEKLYQKLQQQKDILMKELHDMLVQSKKVTLAQVEQIDRVQAQFESVREINKNLVNASDQEVLLVEQELVARVKEITDQYAEMNDESNKPIVIKFIPNETIPFPQFGQLFSSLQCSPLNSEITILPKSTLVSKPVKLTTTTRDHHNRLCSIEANSIAVQIKSGKDVTKLELTNNRDGTCTGSFVPQHVGQATVSVMIEGQQIRGSPHVVMVGRNYLNIEKPSKVINNEAKMGHPWGIAFSKDGIWAVTDCTNFCVYIYDVDDQLVTEFSGSDGAELYNPCGIAFDDSTNLYVVDCSSYGVKKFNICGEYLLHFNSNTEQLENPLGIAVHNDKVYVTSNGCVLVFDTDGQLSGKIGSGVLSATPYDVTVSCYDQLLIADSGFHCIFTFTLNGEYVSKFGTQGVDIGQLNSPHGLTVDADGFILIIDYNHRVSIFDNDGICLHHFGSKGLDSGQFKYPHGIALSPDGKRIFTSDYNNKRVQIFEITE